MKLEWREYLFSDPVAWKTEFFAFASLGQMDHNFHRSWPQQAGKKTRTEIISNLQNLIQDQIIGWPIFLHLPFHFAIRNQEIGSKVFCISFDFGILVKVADVSTTTALELMRCCIPPFCDETFYIDSHNSNIIFTLSRQMHPFTAFIGKRTKTNGTPKLLNIWEELIGYVTCLSQKYSERNACARIHTVALLCTASSTLIVGVLFLHPANYQKKSFG